MHTWFWWGNVKERDHLDDPGVDGRIILRSILRKWDVGVWTGSWNSQFDFFSKPSGTGSGFSSVSPSQYYSTTPPYSYFVYRRALFCSFQSVNSWYSRTWHFAHTVFLSASHDARKTITYFCISIILPVFVIETLFFCEVGPVLFKIPF